MHAHDIDVLDWVGQGPDAGRPGTAADRVEGSPSTSSSLTPPPLTFKICTHLKKIIVYLCLTHCSWIFANFEVPLEFYMFGIFSNQGTRKQCDHSSDIFRYITFDKHSYEANTLI